MVSDQAFLYFLLDQLTPVGRKATLQAETQRFNQRLVLL